MKKTAIVAALAAALSTAACTTTEKVSVMMPGDRAMTCTQLKDEFSKLDVIKRDADSDKGVNGANVAAVLLFWPAAAGNYLNARDAQQLAEQRRTHLMTFYNEKQCDNPANANLTVEVPVELLAPISAGRP
jgi:hypothetical protein